MAMVSRATTVEQVAASLSTVVASIQKTLPVATAGLAAKAAAKGQEAARPSTAAWYSRVTMAVFTVQVSLLPMISP